VSLQDGTLPGPSLGPSLAAARASRPSAPRVWPATAPGSPARDVMLCAIGALLLALAYLYL
jgi:hypothetical protein